MLIIFLEESDQGVQFFHNDAVVVNLNMENYDVHYILIDNESSDDILYFDALTKIGITPNGLTPVGSCLIEFMGDAIQVERMISLTIRMGHYLL